MIIHMEEPEQPEDTANIKEEDTREEDTKDTTSPDDTNVTPTGDDWSILERKTSMDFDEPFDYKPLKKGIFSRLEESLFKAARGKKKVVPVKKPPEQDPFKISLSAFRPSAPKTSPVPMETITMEKSKEFRALEQPKIVGVHPRPLPDTDAGVINLDIPPVMPEPVLPEIKTPVVTPAIAHLPKSKFSSRLSSINKVNVIINGAALAIFVTGAFILYSELPTRPELVIGIVMIAAASGVLATGR